MILHENMRMCKSESDHGVGAVIQTGSTVDVCEVWLPEGQLSVHTHFWCGGHAAGLSAAQLQVSKLQRQRRLCYASLQRWQ